MVAVSTIITENTGSNLRYVANTHTFSTWTNSAPASDASLTQSLAASNFSPVMSIGPDGFVGIGTSAPLYKLSVQNGDIICSGNITAFASSASDRRLKCNVQKLENSMELLMKLEPVSFDWNEDIPASDFSGKKDYGFIAQDVGAVIPEMVHERSFGIHYDPVKLLRYEKLTSFIVRGMQEQQELIMKQQKQIDELLARLV